MDHISHWVETAKKQQIRILAIMYDQSDQTAYPVAVLNNEKPEEAAATFVREGDLFLGTLNLEEGSPEEQFAEITGGIKASFTIDGKFARRR